MNTKLTIFAVVVMVVAAAALIPTLLLPGSEEVSTLVGPRLWPLSLVIALMAFAAFLLVDTRKQVRREADSSTPCESTNKPSESGQTTVNRWSIAANRHWYLIAMTVVYTLLMQALGFLPSTVIFALAMSGLLGARHWGLALATVAIAVVLIQGVFVLLLDIPLP